MAARREQPMYQAPQGLASHSIAAVRLLLRRLVLTPALGRRKVFIVGDAERLTPQRGWRTRQMHYSRRSRSRPLTQ